MPTLKSALKLYFYHFSPSWLEEYQEDQDSLSVIHDEICFPGEAGVIMPESYIVCISGPSLAFQCVISYSPVLLAQFSWLRFLP